MKLFALLMVLVTLSSVFAFSAVQAPGPATTVFLDPNPLVSTIGPGDTVFLNVMISGVPPETPVYALGIKVSWAPPMLQAISVSEMDFLSAGGSKSTFITANINNGEVESYVDVGLTLIGADPGTSGSGTILMIEFYVEGTGTCALDLTSVVLTPNPNYGQPNEPQFLSVDHTDVDGTFYTTVIFWESGLVGKSAWPAHHHFGMAAQAPETNNTLFAKVRNHGSMDVWTKVVFNIVQDSGAPITLETAPYLLTVTEGDHIFSANFDTSIYGPGKYFVEARVRYDTNGDTIIDTWAAKNKTFSFAVVP